MTLLGHQDVLQPALSER